MTASSIEMSFDDRVQELIENIIERQNDYLAECREYAESGHRHHYCFHGVNMWVDYDCACGLCEGGEINEYSDREEIEEYAKDVVRGEMRVEKVKQDRKNKFIELIMQEKRACSYREAEQIYNEIFG